MNNAIPVSIVDEEVARFPCSITSFKSSSYGRWKLELTVAHEDKDHVWPVSDEEGLEVMVAVFRRRHLGVQELADTDTPNSPTRPVLSPTLAANAMLDSWATQDDADDI